MVASAPDRLMPRSINIWILFGIGVDIYILIQECQQLSVGAKFCYKNQNSYMFINFIIRETPHNPIYFRTYL